MEGKAARPAPAAMAMAAVERYGASSRSAGSGGREGVRPVLSPLAAFAAARDSSTPPGERKPGPVAPLSATTGIKAASSRAPSVASDIADASAGTAKLVVSESGVAAVSKEETPCAPTSGVVERASDSTSTDPSVSSRSQGSVRAELVAVTNSRDVEDHGEASGSEELEFLDGSSDDEEEEDDNEHKGEPGVEGRRTSGTYTAEEPDDLYGSGSGSSKADGISHPPERSQPKGTSIRLPTTSDVELFHSVLVKDLKQLKETLRERSPKEVLDIRDADQRTLYHYGALCSDRRIQRAVFSHVDSYNERRLSSQIGKVMEEKGVVDQWLSKCDIGKRDWEPPCVKELTQKFIKVQQHDWELICRSVDRDKRTFLHYAAAAPGCTVFEQDTHFVEAIRARRELIHARDIDGKMPLHIAVEAGNVHAIKWYFSLGIHLNQEDMSCLLHLNHQKLIHEVLAQQLERLDTRAYHARCQEDLGHDESGWDPGLGILARIEIERVQGRPLSRYGASLLLDAVKYGNISAVKLLLRQGINPGVCDSNGWTVIHVCADEGTENHVAIMRLLLDPPHSATVDSRSLKGRTPLHIAVRTRRGGAESKRESARGEIVRTLCDYGADSSALDRKGNTALHLASRSNNVSLVSSLIGLGCNVGAVDNNGRNCLHVAALQGNTEVVKYLLSWEEEAGYLSTAGDNRGRKPMEVARNERTRQLLTNQWRLCYHGNAEGVKRLLGRSGTTTDAASVQPFVSEQTVQTMRTPLHLAVQGFFDLLQLSDSSKHKRATHSATRQVDLCRGRYQQVTLLLLHAGADPCAADKWGITPIMIAAAIDDELLLETLLESCLSSKRLQDADQDGNTALHYSYAFCNARNSSIMEDAMDEDEPTNNVGKTPLEMTGFRNRAFPAGYRTHLRGVQRHANQIA